MKKPGPVPLAPGLYMVSTPVGNLRDITLRALDVLEGADLIACEDTRVTGKLLEAFSLKKKMLSYNDHNAPRRRGEILAALGNGQAVALVSDAGTPLLSDPGYKLVRDCIDLGFGVVSVPGANALLPALQLSGLPPDRFFFAGFLPPKSAARRAALEDLKSVPATLIFYETGPRLAASLKDMAEVLGDRPAAVAREITKKFEECRRGMLSRLAADYGRDGAPKGEIVVTVDAGMKEIIGEDELIRQLGRALETMSVREAAAHVAQAAGQPRKKLYEMALALNRDR